MSSGETDGTEAILLGVRHKVRRGILRQLESDGGNSLVSPRELSESMQLPLPNVTYHVRVLSESGLIRLAGTQEVHGSVQHFYEMTELVDHPIAQASLGAIEP